MKFTVTALALSTVILLGACSKKQEAPPPEVQEEKQEKSQEKAQVENPAQVGEFYITNQQGPVSIYSLADYSKLGEISVGEGGRGVGIADNEKLLAVAVPASNDIAIIDLATREALRRISVGDKPETIQALGAAAYAALGMALSANGEHIIVPNETDDTISIYELETAKLIKTIQIREYGMRPRSITRSPNGEQFAVTLEYSNKILLLDSDYNITQEIFTGEVPYGISYNRAGTEIVVTLARGKAIQVFDTKTFELKRELPIGERCLHFSFTPDDKKLVVACGRSNSVLVLNAETGELIKELPEPDRMPWGVVMSPESVGSPGSAD